MSKLWIGIDPGANGCLCILSDTNIEFYDFKKIGLMGYKNLLKSINPTMIALELVRARPGQGVVSMFSMGQRVGELEGLLIGLEKGYIQVRPQEWQKTCKVPKKSGKKGIAETMLKMYPSAQLFGPKGGLLDGRADALGLAHHLRTRS